jgi:hypothetical protein
MVWGGRAPVRAVLYMGGLVATRRSKEVQRLRDGAETELSFVRDMLNSPESRLRPPGAFGSGDSSAIYCSESSATVHPLSSVVKCCEVHKRRLDHAEVAELADAPA